MIKIIWISQSFSWCFEYLAEKSKTNLSQNYQENCATCLGTNMLRLKFLIFLLNWFRSGSHELSNKISPLSSNKLYFRDSKFLGLYSVLFCLFVFTLYLRASKKKQKKHNQIIKVSTISYNNPSVIKIDNLAWPTLFQYLFPLFPKWFSKFHCRFTKIFIDERTCILWLCWILQSFFFVLISEQSTNNCSWLWLILFKFSSMMTRVKFNLSCNS